MPRYLKLSDSEIHRLVGGRGDSRQNALIEAALQILSRNKGSYLTLDHIDEVLRDLSRNLISDSLAGKVSSVAEAMYEEANKTEE